MREGEQGEGASEERGAGEGASEEKGAGGGASEEKREQVRRRGSGGGGK